MQFRAEQYYQAAVERLSQAQHLYDLKGARAATIYWAGVAVECLLRAFRWLHDQSFEGRHDLRALLKASRIMEADAEYMRSEGAAQDEVEDALFDLQEAVESVARIWNNNLRFASEASLRAYLHTLGLLKGVKGDALKKNAADVLKPTAFVVQRGRTLWAWKTK